MAEDFLDEIIAQRAVNDPEFPRLVEEALARRARQKQESRDRDAEALRTGEKNCG